MGDGGGAAVDVFLADSASVPPLEGGVWPHFAERLALLPRGMSLFPPPPPLPHAPLPGAATPEAAAGAMGDSEAQGEGSSWPAIPRGATMLLSLSSAYKVDEPTFALWMSVLRRLPLAVLVLLHHLPGGAASAKGGGAAAEAAAWRARARAAAASHGVLPSRLLFARGVGRQQHRARLAVPPASGGPVLALDTPAYNGGATALDLLSARVPLLTVVGSHRVVTRMAAAILRAAGGGSDPGAAALALITHNLQQYETSAVRLAQPVGMNRGARGACLAARHVLRRALVLNATEWAPRQWVVAGMEPLLAAAWEVQRQHPSGARMHVVASEVVADQAA